MLQVDDSSAETVPQIVTTASTGYTNASVPQVNINGQLYVIGNPNEVFTTQGGTRAIAPRSSIIEQNTNVSNIRNKVSMEFLHCNSYVKKHTLNDICSTYIFIGCK